VASLPSPSTSYKFLKWNKKQNLLRNWGKNNGWIFPKDKGILHYINLILNNDKIFKKRFLETNIFNLNKFSPHL